nr:MAG TPA: hypothetical protein [Caudoviricetes sp.]
MILTNWKIPAIIKLQSLTQISHRPSGCNLIVSFYL